MVVGEVYKMRSGNPFDILFGRVPDEYISRKGDLKEIYDSLSSGSSSNNVFIISGTRGCGKTVALTDLSFFYEDKDEWIIIDLNPECELLKQLVAKILDEGRLNRKLFSKAEFNFSFIDPGFFLSGDEPINDISTLLRRELEYLKCKGKKLLITIDDVSGNRYTKAFAHEFQSLLRENYDVYLIIDGLYQNIASYSREKGVTFLHRAKKIYLKGLNLLGMASSYKRVFSLSEEESLEIAEFTKGYAYAFQLLGDILIESGDYSLSPKNVEKFEEIIYERAYSVIYDELSRKEKEILIASLENNENASIMKKVGVSKSQLSRYKTVLSQKGVIEKDAGSVVLALPRFKEMLPMMNSFYDIEI